MPLDFFIFEVPIFLSIISGIIVGLSLGLFGGGGSVLAVPMLLYGVGVKDVHVAIGTSAFAVGIIAFVNLFYHKRNGNVKFKKGIFFTLPGIAGTIIGAQLGLWTSSENLLVFFALFMVLVAFFMLRKKSSKTIQNDSASSSILVQKNKIPFSGLAVGILAGYFGIGGGFLIVPTLMYSGALSITQAIGTSLISVSSFGLITAGNYIIAEQIDFFISFLFIGGGVIGGIIGTKMSQRIPSEKMAKGFAVMLVGISAYILFKSAGIS